MTPDIHPESVLAELAARIEIAMPTTDRKPVLAEQAAPTYTFGARSRVTGA